jgi:hypothetical protein
MRHAAQPSTTAHGPVTATSPASTLHASNPMSILSVLFKPSLTPLTRLIGLTQSLFRPTIVCLEWQISRLRF